MQLYPRWVAAPQKKISLYNYNFKPSTYHTLYIYTHKYIYIHIHTYTYIYSLTYLLHGVLLEKLTDFHLVEKFP